MDFVIVIPAKDEGLTIEHVLMSLCNQTVLPKICIVVDDNSTDNTAEIVRSYAKKYPFIRYHQYIITENSYVLGSRVVEIFNYGWQIIQNLNIRYDYIVKLDADVSFENDFFEKIFKESKGKKLGIFSGTPYFLRNGTKVLENNPLWHSRGQFKIYNKTCLEQIGGLPASLGWDCADNIKAMQLGWTTMAFPNIDYRMHRKIGGKHSLKKGKVNHGLGAYYLGYSSIYLFMRTISLIFRPPYISGAYYFLTGYFRGVFSSKKRILSPTQVTLLRKLLWGSLFQRLKLPSFALKGAKKEMLMDKLKV